MKLVIVVGAGATLSEASGRQLPRSRLPPLDKSFLRLCVRAKLQGVSEARNYALEQFGFDPFEGQTRMEELFNALYSDAFSSDPPPEALDAYWALIRMYTLAISRTTNQLTGAGRGGIGAIVREVWQGRWDHTNLTLITFNQDLVIEKALEAMKGTRRYSDFPWNIRECYRIRFPNGFSSIGGTRFTFRETGASVPLLKMHGSLNWLYTVRSRRDPKNVLRNPSGLYCLNFQRIVTGSRHRSRRGYRMVPSIPLIVPPIFEKVARYQKTVGPVWGEAAKELEAAEELLFFGYSFPETDIAARNLLKRAIHKNQRIRRVRIIDPDSGVAARITDLLGVDTILHYRNSRAFIREIRDERNRFS